MPIYEYYCPDNHRVYSFLARTLAEGGRVPRCPDDPAYRMERMLSRVSVIRRLPEPAANPAGEGSEDPDDPRMERALAEMEREFAGLSEENPDPRTLGRMMRRMAELTGQRMPGEFEEMTRRLEAGEDPDRLEAEYGDVLEGMDDSVEPAGEPPAAGRRLRRFLPPQRDPKLYELRDYLD